MTRKAMGMGPGRLNAKEAEDIRKMGRAVKSYGKNVVGGAKIVGSAIKSKVLKAFKKS